MHGCDRLQATQEPERALAVLASREDRERAYRRRADAAGLRLDAFSTWMLIRAGQSQPIALAQLARGLNSPVSRLQSALDRLADETCIHREDGTVSLTRRRGRVRAGLVELRSERLERLLRGWPPEQRTEMANTIHALAERLLSDDFDQFLATSRMQLRMA